MTPKQQHLEKLLSAFQGFQSGVLDYPGLRSACLEEEPVEEKYKINIMNDTFYESVKIPSKECIVCESPEVESPELTKKFSDLTTKGESILRSFLSSEQVTKVARQESSYTQKYQEKYAASQSGVQERYARPALVERLLGLVQQSHSLEPHQWQT